MRMFLAVLVFFSLTCASYSADFSVINDETVKTFMEVLPLYVDICKKYGEVDNVLNQPLIEGQAYAAEVQAMFNKYGLTFADFPVLVQKITMGLAAVQMEASGLSNNMFGMKLHDSLNDDEKAVIKKYSDQLQALFEGLD